MAISYSLNTGFKCIIIVMLLAWMNACQNTGKTPQAEVWLTQGDQSSLFEKQGEQLKFNRNSEEIRTIKIDSSKTYQRMEGFGFALTGGSAMVINQLDEEEQDSVLENLFSTEGKSIGLSYLRISIGASDLNDHVFSYDDLPENQTDTDMSEFTLGPDTANVVPVLKKILAINPDIKILGSPWSSPLWMKTNHNAKGGSLMPKYYDAYALYFVKFIKAMKDQGIMIDAITPQNEPLTENNTPSMLMLAKDQIKFIKDHLGPTFEQHHIDTKIITYDHNLDRIDYSLTVLNDPEAKKYVAGSAFHLYAGSIDSMSKVHKQFPEKKLYFTEQWVGADSKFAHELQWYTKNIIIGAPRNWSANVIGWNLAADPNQDPHTNGGCTKCLGALTIGKQVSRNVAYYIFAHASKFVRPGSKRIASTAIEGLPNVAYQTSSGKKVLIVLNDRESPKKFQITEAGRSAVTSLDAGSVATYVW